MKLIITKHAQQQMDDRGITIQQVAETIKKGAKQKQTDGFISRYTYIGVAYKIMKEKYIIKTAFILD